MRIKWKMYEKIIKFDENEDLELIESLKVN
jgi:hypothetical protein